jgi:type II secretory ATPase GspE/PulE/Tfp pilus assembly ATPase PilB-like protein
MTANSAFGMQVKTDISLADLPRELINSIPYSFVRKHLVLPIKEKADHVQVAMSDPLNLNALEELGFMLDKKIVGVLVAEEKLLFSLTIVITMKREKRLAFWKTWEKSALQSPQKKKLRLTIF